MVRAVPTSALALLLWSAISCTSDHDRLAAVLADVAHGPADQLGRSIYGYEVLRPGARKAVVDLLQPLRAPAPNQNAQVEAVWKLDRFAVAAVRVPWNHKDPLYPVIFCLDQDRPRIVGYVLPFDDLIPRFFAKDKDLGAILELHGRYRTYSDAMEARSAGGPLKSI